MIELFYGIVILIMMKFVMNTSIKKMLNMIFIYSCVNIFLIQIQGSSILTDVILLETLCLIIYYHLDHCLSEILFYLSFMCFIKNLFIVPQYILLGIIIYCIVALGIIYVKKQFPIHMQNVYWLFLSVVSLSTLCIYHILYNDFLDILGINRNVVILLTLLLTIIISYYLFLRNSVLTERQQLIQDAIDNFKNEQKQYAYIEKKNSELYKLRHDLKYDYLQMQQYIKKHQYDHMNEIINQKLDYLNHDYEMICSGHKLIDSYINMKLEQIKQNEIHSKMIVSVHDLSYIDDQHLHIFISYMFDLAIEASLQNEKIINIQIIEDTSAFEMTMTIPGKIPENINKTTLETLKLLLKKYQGNLYISSAQNASQFYISLLIPAK